MLGNTEVMKVVEAIRPGTFAYFSSVMGMNDHAATFRELQGKFGFQCTTEQLDEMDRMLAGTIKG
jgi:hypothetical protein